MIFKNKTKSNDYLISLFFIFSGIICLCILFYRGLFIISKNNKNQCDQNKEKILISHDKDWYQKQKKYLKGGKLIPISFESIENKKNKDQKIKRNGLLMLKDHAKATILICHGFMTSKEDMSLLRYIFSDYNVLTFDFRAHGEECSDQLCTLGRNEKYDVIGAVKFIKKHPKLKNKPLFVYAFSMGAVASIMAESEEQNLFKGAILDCPFESTADLIERAFRKMKINLFGFNIDLPGLNFIKRYFYHSYIQDLIKFMLRVFAKMDATQISTMFKPVSPKEAITNVKIPLFLISCHNDEKAPPSALYSIYENAKSSKYKRLWISTGRKHFDSFFTNPEKYTYKINSFIKKILSGNYEKKEKNKIKEDPCIYKISLN